MSFRSIPKVELHTHLEGCAPPAFIRGLAKEKNIDISDGSKKISLGVFDRGISEYRKFLWEEELQLKAQKIKEINDKHTAELKELNNYTRERDLETQEALAGTVVAVESIHALISNKFRLLD